jgi:hypothetical protein
LTLAMPGAATARKPPHRPAAPAIVGVEASALPDGQRRLTATTTGRRLLALFVCDVDEYICAAAVRTGAHTWSGVLPPGDADHTLGAIGRAGRSDFVWAAFDYR